MEKLEPKFIEELVDAVRADGEYCDAEVVQRLIESLDEDGRSWLALASYEEVRDWTYRTLINTQPPLDE